MTSTLLALSQLAAPAATPAAEESAKPEGGATSLPELVVQADGTKKLYKPENLTSKKYTVPIRDVPQTVTVLPQEVIREQGATSLRDVLRNVPGISMQAGEGGGGPSGDNLAIRGFAARSDIFVDGFRDSAGGGYTRDPFNIEQVEVAKGPASANSGRGSTGGSVNIASKTAHLGNSYGGAATVGTDELYRGTFDVNQELPYLKGTAFRLNGLLHSQDIADRDGVEQERWGVAPTITFGLGTDTRFTLSYMHLDQENTPDYGLPWVPRNSTVVGAGGTPVTVVNNTGLDSGIPSVSYENWYGNSERDYEEIQTDIFTAAFEHDINESLKLTSGFRYSRNDRDSVTTAPRFVSDTSVPGTTSYNSTVLNQQFQSRDQLDTGFYNQTNFVYDFATGSVEHTVVTGFEISREESKNYGRSVIDPATGLPILPSQTPQIDLLTGEQLVPYVGRIERNGSYTSAEVESAAVYLFDTAKIDEHWEVSGGLRFDSTRTDYTSYAVTPTPLLYNKTVGDDVLSYRASVTYKPVREGSIYFGYGSSYNPSTELLTYGTTAANIGVDPEESETMELGAKWEFFEQKLLVTGALFRTDKSNARTTDPVTDEVSVTGEQVVQGVEVGFTGSITDKLRLIGGYTFLDSEVEESANPHEVGNEVSNTPENSFSLWAVHDLPAGFSVGVGSQYVGSRYNNSNGETRQKAPDFILFNAMASYDLNENVTFRLNADNLFDEEYIDRVGGGHFVPGVGRTISLTADFQF
ncbi:TonB-dependent siderophore receptor [Luteolibacter yonseiensis]|uniref:TonB-dependent siderophore receptor n=2 Tax=Luteolibacter yonseiensis TaxID=1144680 RepID=A0A934R049_9BACT|nr:TonB-dependent siderophore receptor [Luteolibacter yonseiensis]MBK1815943.1 TonB-dependent siderophore receptor [Luteolibacter yonseiensis]